MQGEHFEIKVKPEKHPWKPELGFFLLRKAEIYLKITFSLKYCVFSLKRSKFNRKCDFEVEWVSIWKIKGLRIWILKLLFDISKLGFGRGNLSKVWMIQDLSTNLKKKYHGKRYFHFSIFKLFLSFKPIFKMLFWRNFEFETNRKLRVYSIYL